MHFEVPLMKVQQEFNVHFSNELSKLCLPSSWNLLSSAPSHLVDYGNIGFILKVVDK